MAKNSGLSAFLSSIRSRKGRFSASAASIAHWLKAGRYALECVVEEPASGEVSVASLKFTVK
jgi:hypothetical protein